MSTPEVLEAAAKALGALAERSHPLGALTTFRVGGPAALFATVADRAALATVRSAVVSTGVELLVVGRGSNLLVADTGFPGLALCLGEGFAQVSVSGTEVEAGGAASLPVVARRCVADGLTGFEWAVGVPGSVGGAVRMNAGGHGSQLDEVLVAAEVADLSSADDPLSVWRDRRWLGLAYRFSNLADTDVVLAVRLTLREGRREESEEQLSEIVAWRRRNQPGGQNCGSVFTNPEGDSAGRLIESVGLKGYRVGSAHVSTKHANFFQADPGGRASDMRALIEEVAASVQQRTGIVLRAEVRMVGF